MPLHTQSIVVLRYPGDAAKGHATGFFVDTKHYGRVCVTAAHVFSKNFHPGPDRTKILVNGRLTELSYNAFDTLGIDVALVKIPHDLSQDMIICHTPGVSLRGDSAYYAHAWSGPKADPNSLTFTKIWGVRFGPLETIDNDADPLVAERYMRWRLRSDVGSRDRSEPAIFQPGWSGAPVFNVRAAIANQRVIGVLSKTNGDREAFAVSVESLEFLEPREPQNDEIFPVPPGSKWVPDLRADASQTTLADINAQRFEEILNQRAVPKIRAPLSPYDQLRP
ncbi:MAG: hypothetical protein JO093_20115 [Acidobacteria bacterium]|nr:hypothetical protein [Acidobacteriota bacterium]MBV9070015.1 hypothetical protein [Acidobacteriota bacterium]MBV9187930.1 hypothetical protein [Acidobacteriota bacterium]